MSVCNRSGEKRRIYHEFRRQEEEVIGSLCRLGSRPSSPKSQLEQEKRIRREIANSNERRRMQSINAGFQSLRTLLPHHEGEKLSKAAILQHTSEFIYQLEQEKTRLLTQNCHLKRLLNNQLNPDSDASSLDSPLPKRKKPENTASNHGLASADFDAKKRWKAQAESSDEGIGNMSPSGKEPTMEDLRRELLELRVQLDRERRLRMVLEDQNHNLLQDQTKMKLGDAFPYSTSANEEEVFVNERKPHELIHQQHASMSNEYQDREEKGDGSQTDNEQGGIEYKCISLIATVDEIPEDLSSTPKTIIVTNSSNEFHIEAQCSPNETPCISIPSPTHSRPSPSNSPILHQMSNSVPIIRSEEEMNQVSISNQSQLTLAQPSLCHVVSQQQPPRLYHASTSRQNLETIVEAIRHLEGDHLFCDDHDPKSTEETDTIDGSSSDIENIDNALSTQIEETLNNDSRASTCHVVLQNGGHEYVRKEMRHEQREETSNTNVDSRSSTCNVALQNGGHEYVRKQIIHSTIGNSTRPGVIVSNHT